MKWFLFLFWTIFLFSCKNKGIEKVSEKLVPPQIRYNDTVQMPWGLNPQHDTGYFKGYIPEKLSYLETNDSTFLFQFLSNIIDKRDIALLDSETLSNSVFINQNTEIRFDTLKNEQTIILSEFKFSDPEYQKISINGNVIKGHNGTENDILIGDFIDFNCMSFRHFSFKGNEFYYINAGSTYSFGTSMGNVKYHLIYNIRNKRLNCFQTCRFGYMLFGDVDGDDRLDYLDFDNSDFCPTVPLSGNVRIRFYSCDSNGNFVLQKDKKGNDYFIDGNTGENLGQDSFIVKKHYWPIPLK